MICKSVRIFTYALAAAAVFSVSGLTAEATSEALPSGGFDITLSRGTSLENLQEEAGANTAQIESLLDRVALEEARREAGLDVESSEEEELKSLVIAVVDDYVNVRSLPDENSEVLGKLYHHSVGTFLAEENGWYQISSGTVTGYVKAEYCVTGEAAIELAKDVSTRIATVNTETLKVRKEPSMDAEVLTLIPDKDQLVVSEERDGWVQVDTQEGMGWISTEYCILSREFVEAESKAEEEARLAREEEERRKAQEAASKEMKKSTGAGAQEIQEPSITSGTSSEMGQAVIDFALQFVGNPYVYGGTSLTKGADCSGFVMSVYAHFGVSLPHSSGADRKQGYAVDGLANAQPGDIVCYSGHVALYVGNNQIVHASNSRTGIIVSEADYKKVLAVRRIF